jgi:hypothetical protein
MSVRYEHDFFVYRPLLPESAAQLRRLQKEYGAIRSFGPAKSLHLAILHGHTKRRLASHKLEEIMSDAPKGSEDIYDTEITGVKLDRRTRDVTRLAIRLILDSETGERYLEEHEAYKKAVNTVDKTMLMSRLTQPQLTIGYLDVSHGLASTMDGAEALIGTTLHFGGVGSNMGKAHVIPDLPEADRHTPMLIDTPVRTVQLGGIPQGFLSSLRPRDSGV